MKNILFLSAHNACRSQMAEALTNHHYRGKIKAYSAGVQPRDIHPVAAQVMEEIGISIDEHTSNKPEDFRDVQFDYIITLCNDSREACPLFWTTGEAVYEHIQFDDPFEMSGDEQAYLERCRDARDSLEEKLMEFFDREIKNAGSAVGSR